MKRCIAATLVLLALGATVNVAIAWGAMLRDPPPHPLSSAYGRPKLDDPVGFLKRYFPELDPADDHACGGNMYRGRGWRELVASCHSDQAVNIIASVRVLQAGWPLPAVQGRTEEYRGTMRHVAFIPRSAATRNPLTARHDHLPYEPVWPGFIINTLFFALLPGIIFFAPLAARRLLRRWRGRCEKCAYPIGVGPVCTECGAAFRRKPET